MSSILVRSLLISLGALSVAGAAHAESARVLSLTPAGSVKQVQQVVARFTTDMMAMGDPRSANDPFTVNCTGSSKDSSGKKAKSKNMPQVPKFTTRWADSRSWSLDFEKPVGPGIRCALTLKNDVRDLGGSLVQGLGEYSFATAGPALLDVTPIYGDIEPDQYFVAQVEGGVDLKSIDAGAYFEVEGMPDKVGVKIVSDKERDVIVRAAIEDSWRWDAIRQLLRRQPGLALSQIPGMENFLVLAAARRFPEDAKIVLHWTTGVKSTSGMAVEEPQTYNFKVIPPFTADFSCERTAPDRPCNPILGMRLAFSKRLSLASLKGTKLVGDNGMVWVPEELKSGDQNKNAKGVFAPAPHVAVGVSVVSRFEDAQVDGLTFKPPFPEKTKFKLVLPPNLKDELERKLTNQDKFPLETATDEYSPLIKFPAPFGILELKADPLLPVSVRNVEKQLATQKIEFEGRSFSLSGLAQAKEVIGWYKRVMRKEYRFEGRNSPVLGKGQGSEFKLPKPLGEREFELMGIPLKKPGFHVVEMASPRLGKALTGKGAMYVASAALVTDIAVHFKKGRESSLVWVTNLSDGKPVSAANILVLADTGTELAKGVSTQDGTFRFGKVPYPCSSETEEGESDGCDVFVFAQKGEDFSFASSEWSKGIESYRFNVSLEYLSREWGPTVAHTVLNRMVAQPGDVIHMKHVLREHKGSGFGLMAEKYMPKRVLVVHEGSRKTYALPLDVDRKWGVAISTFTIPKSATLGRYSVFLSNKKRAASEESGEIDPDDWSAQNTGSFLVSEYRLPLMKASVKVQGDPLVRPNDVKVDLSAGYLNGGPAKDLKVKLRATLQPGYFRPDVAGASEYTFFSEPAKAGVFDHSVRVSTEESFLKVQELKLGQDGGHLATISKLPGVTKISRLAVEMEYTDPNGEVKTAGTDVPLFPAEYVVGLRSESWFHEPGKTMVSGVITDVKGKLKPAYPYIVDGFLRRDITHRKRLVGGFYAYDSRVEVVALGKLCEGTSDDNGRFECRPKNLPAGSITLQARVSDSRKNTIYAAVGISVFEPGEFTWWTPSDSDRIDVIPEKSSFEPGEKAMLVVRSPYPVATALVTVEREGVLDSFVTEVRRDKPSIEVPIKGHYAPNVFVSALLVRGRIGDPKPTALLDLARPAMKMGLTEIKVGWKHHELAITVRPDKTRYQARDKAQVVIQVKAANGAPLPEGGEVAVVAVDEALLRLGDNTSWDLLAGMMGLRSLGVRTSSGQNQVIGKRHYGSKSKPPGGGGGLSADPRELFDPMLLWQPRVKLDKNGEARLTIPLSDSMTSFRIEAVGMAGVDMFGSGHVSIESTKDLIIYSGFAPLAREGDAIKNVFTLRNTTPAAMKVAVEASSPELSSLPKIADVDLKPSEAKTVTLPVTIPVGLTAMSFKLKAKDKSSGAEDAMIAKVRVPPAVPSRVMQATLFQLEKDFQVPVKQPADGLPGKGGLSVSARASLVTGLTGVKNYMEEYTYSCLEQKVSKAIALEDKASVENVIEEIPAYMDETGLLKFFPLSRCGNAQLTRYVLDILDENGYAIPGVTQKKILSGMKSYVKGETACVSWWDEYVRDPYVPQAHVLAMEALSRFKEFKPEMLSTVKITPNLWKSETVAAWFQILKREPSIPHRANLLKQADTILKSRLNFQGSSMNLQGDLDWEAQWHLFSSRDQESLSVFGVAVGEKSWKQDVGRMARGTMARLRAGHWDTTMANAWGVTRMRQFSAAFEKDHVAGTTKVAATGVQGDFDWKAKPKGDTVLYPWPKGSETNSIPVRFSHAGTGKPWINLQTVSAIPLKAPFDAGYKITRTITPVLQAAPGTWHVGDVANVELTITAKADQAWVVVRDPVPAGAAHLGAGLAGSSNILDRAPKSKGKNKGKTDDVEAWPTEFDERSFADFISYAAYLPRGSYRVNYRIRLNSAGEFKLPPSRVEAMYSPETFGEVPNASWVVAP